MPTELPALRLVMTTLPDAACAETLAGALVKAGHAACVSIVPGLRSVYRWQGRVEHADEVLLLIKVCVDNYAALETALRAAHPYELPEIIAVAVTDGLPAYLQWVTASCRPADTA